jgi:hypothetical protein
MRATAFLLFSALVASVTVGACARPDNGVGSPCDRIEDCAADLQCLDQICVPRCQRAPDCGDGHACSEDGLCVVGDRQSGDRCDSEVQCEPGLACVLDATDGGDGVLEASCAPDRDGHAFGAGCDSDADCRNGTCAMSHCVDVCAIDRDCAAGYVCTTIPRIDGAAAYQGDFHGCLAAGGTIESTIPVTGGSDAVFIPVPGNARSTVIVMSVDDESQYVGANELTAPDGTQLFENENDPFDVDNRVRHTPTKRQSALMIPSIPGEFMPGAYLLDVSSYRINPQGQFTAGSATPRVKAITKLGDGTVIDLHFYFLDLSQHPCSARLGPTTFNAAAAEEAAADTNSGFRRFYLDQLRLIFARAGIAQGIITFDDLPGHADLDGLEVAALPDLLQLSTRPNGVSVFFVRTITPVGIQVLSGGADNPGDPSVGSRTGGVAVSVDTMCYRTWQDLARVTAHGIARHMGLFRNVEPDGINLDPIPDTPAPDPMNPELTTSNLMHFSEFGGTEISEGQEDILRRSPVLR